MKTIERRQRRARDKYLTSCITEIVAVDDEAALQDAETKSTA